MQFYGKNIYKEAKKIIISCFDIGDCDPLGISLPDVVYHIRSKN